MTRCKKCEKYGLTNDEGLCLKCARKHNEKIEKLYDSNGKTEYDCPMPTLCSHDQIKVCYEHPERRCGLYTHKIGE